MNNATILEPTSRKQVSNPAPIGLVSDRLEEDRRKSSIWEPKAVNYGGGTPLIVGFDTEFQRGGGGQQGFVVPVLRP
jgi:hypothetical protein